MKKTLLLLAVSLFPLSAAAMKPMSETDLSLVAGQSGVSFFIDITMDIHIDTLAWGDSDGLSPGAYNPWGYETSGGYVGVTDFTMSNLSVKPYLAGPDSVSFWPETSTIDVYNGVPYYRVHAGPGNR